MEEDRAGLGGLRDVDGDVDVGTGVVAQPGRVHLQVGDLRRHVGGRVVEVAVEQLQTVEARGVRDPVDRLQDRVDLQLVRFLLLRGDARLVGGLTDERLKLDQERC